jgi:hypothetical protein
MAKKLGTGAGSKLSGAAPSPTVDLTALAVPKLPEAPKAKPERLGLVSKKPATRKPRSYRLRPTDLERLSKIVEAVNGSSSGRRITETDVLRGLIVIGENTKQKQLIDAIRAAML